jgi:hypothetical protein
VPRPKWQWASLKSGKLSSRQSFPKRSPQAAFCAHSLDADSDTRWEQDEDEGDDSPIWDRDRPEQQNRRRDDCSHDDDSDDHRISGCR